MSGHPPFDSEVAKRLIGTHVLVGVTVCEHDGTVVEQIQFHGRVESADEQQGIRLRLEGARNGEAYLLPPQTDVFKPARPGMYRLRSTGEEIENPDYTVTWTMSRPCTDHD